MLKKNFRVTITRKLMENHLSGFMPSKPENRDEWDRAPEGSVGVCQAVCNPLPVSSPPSLTEVGSAETHQWIEKQLKETDFERPKQEPE